MPDKTINFGEPGSGARYRTRDDDPTGGGDYVVAETLDASGNPVDVLLRYDDTADEWVSGGPVNMSGNDVTNVGALDADSLSAGDLTGTYPGQVRAFAGGDVVYSADPTTTTDPIRAARDAISSATSQGGTICIPPGPNLVEESPNLSGLEDIILKGHGVETSRINFSNAGANDDGLVVDSNSPFLGLDGVGLYGPGSGTGDGHGIHVTGPTRGFRPRNVKIQDWGGKGIKGDNVSGPFEGDWGRVVITQVGATDTPFLWECANAPNSCDVLKIGCTGQEIFMDMNGGKTVFQTINVGGTIDGQTGTGAACHLRGGASDSVTINHLNFEPTTFNGSHVVRMDALAVHRVEQVLTPGVTVDYIYLLTASPENKYLGMTQEGKGSVNIVDIQQDPGGDVIYEGASGDVDNNTGGALTAPGVSCLADQTLIT